jgi:hypothetical protein
MFYTGLELKILDNTNYIRNINRFVFPTCFAVYLEYLEIVISLFTSLRLT